MMKAAILTYAGFEIQTVETPIIGDDEILVRTLACGVCSGDLFVYKNREKYAATYNRLGHEASGEITAVGRNITSFAVGDIVTALSIPAYSDYFVATAGELVKLPHEISPNYALGEAIACCVHAANRFRIQPGDKVAVVGCGFMGQVCLQLAKYQVAGFICAIDPIAERRDLAKQFGAEATYDPFTTTGADILAAHGEFDVVIEAAGTQSAVDLCTELVTQHGLISLVGYHQSNSGLRTVNMQQWNFKAIDVVNGHVRRTDEKLAAMQQGMELIRQGHIQTDPLVTLYEFDNIESAFRNLAGGTPNLLKAVIVMGK